MISSYLRSLAALILGLANLQLSPSNTTCINAEMGIDGKPGSYCTQLAAFTGSFMEDLVHVVSPSVVHMTLLVSYMIFLCKFKRRGGFFLFLGLFLHNENV